MKLTARKAIMALLLLVFLGSTAMVIYQYFQQKEAESAYQEAAEMVSLPDLQEVESALREVPAEEPALDETAPEEEEEPKQVYVDPYADALRDMDFTALREVNPDVLGWILIPNTRVSYPIVQGTDNTYYLKHTWRKTHSDAGAIFVECQNSGDLTEFHTIFYGHRMNNRSMFGTLDSYQNADYLAAHPVVYVTDDRGSHAYRVFAMYETPVDSLTYRIGLTQESQKQTYIDWCLEQSVQDTGIVPTVEDRILTLSTCTGRGHATRWVVQAVLTGELPSETAEAEQSSEELTEETMEEQTAQDSAEMAEGEMPSGEPENAVDAPQPEDAAQNVE